MKGFTKTYANYSGSKHLFINSEWLLISLLFGSIGAITWAIRGTAGWGGVDGTVIPGLTWGILWYYIALRKGIDARGIVFWLGLGIALGGELGYGQYTGWIRGNFNVGDEVIAIKPWLGYFWFTICGIGWAAPGGIVLGWALGKSVSVQVWLVRSITFAVLLVLLFSSPAIDWLGEILLKTNCGILFPNIKMGIYTDLGEHLSRTLYTNTQNFAIVVWWILAMFVAAWQRDKTTLISGLILGGGFGIGFMQSAMWTLGYDIAPGYIDWWKVWELNSGFNLGVLYAIVLYWAIHIQSKKNKSEKLENKVNTKPIGINNRMTTLFLAFSGSVLLYFIGFEYFFWTGIALNLFYFLAICFTGFSFSKPESIYDKLKNTSLIYSIFLLIFLLFHGGSERFGIVFNLYELNEVSQYSWPVERIFVFVPIALFITGVVIFKIWKGVKSGYTETRWDLINPKSALRIVDLLTLIGCIGVLSIWPAKISVFYSLFLAIAIYVFNRLEFKYRNE
ncbi:hypothetical protein OU798_22680 [Prolixibacteraceae bacterium Z1-6]|uniref:Uncharacterized protein n=1 Tax=Draconibacterium aestuarii TaxID=2998507 RepID=A0A9X3FB86_9BACT|nr:hypothetical protein [Prolixibacteraceae bacterium Z1-6]